MAEGPVSDPPAGSPAPGTAPAGSPASGDPLSLAFYARDVAEVARELLGCVLVQGTTAGRIVETEAYHQREAACHGWRPPPLVPAPTARTAALFGPPGRVYVYRSYGIHAMVNAVCEDDGVAAAVLVRALEPLGDLAGMRDRRGGRPDRELANGPGKLAQALGVALDQDGDDLTTGPLRILGRADGEPEPATVAAPRVGITRAVELPWRFAVAGSPWVSRPRPAG